MSFGAPALIDSDPAPTSDAAPVDSDPVLDPSLLAPDPSLSESDPSLSALNLSLSARSHSTGAEFETTGIGSKSINARS